MRLADLPDDQTLLDQHAEPVPHPTAELWEVAGTIRDRGEALGLIRTCLLLDLPVEPVYQTTIIDRIVERLARLEQATTPQALWVAGQVPFDTGGAR